MKNIIYGAGAFGRIFYYALSENGVEIDSFVDDALDGEKLFGIDVMSLSKYSKNDELTFYISTLQHSKKIEKKLLVAGFQNIYSFNQTILKYPKIFDYTAKKNYLWMSGNREKMINSKIDKVIKLLRDEKSRVIVNNFKKFRETFDVKYYVNPEGKEYFANDVPILKNISSLRFIDCGAYIGDTIEVLMRENIKKELVISFEPDCNNLKKLEKNIAKYKENNGSINFVIFPHGVYSKNGILNFQNKNTTSSSAISDSADSMVGVVTLDTTIFSVAPNYIKMDIEGAEKEALLGAKKTIQRYKPNLAICLYHKPEDLWKLPLLIHEINPDYDMFVRVHEDMFLSTVLYCIGRK